MEERYLISFCSNCVHDEELQKEIELRAVALLKGVLSEKDDYQKEKALKVFCEGLTNLENSLLYSRGIHPNQYNLSDYNYMDKYNSKFEEVRKIMRNEISRQFRHFTIMF